MTKIQTKRVYDPLDPADGYRVLVDKVWPRGLKKEEVQADVWNKSIAPSTELRKWYHEDRDNRWSEFESRYLQELQENPAVQIFIENVKEKAVVTLLYSAHDQMHNQAVVLKAYLTKIING